MKIIMLTPLVLGLLFFTYSAITGLIAVRDTKIFETAPEAKFEIGNFEIQQIDEKTNTVKWSLKASQTQSDPGQTQAKITNPNLIFFNPPVNGSKHSQPRFTITSSSAYLNKAEQEVNLFDNVLLLTSDGKFQIRSGKLKFKEELPVIVVSDHWTLNSSSGYVIAGQKGLINKDFKSIVSQVDASLTKLTGSNPINMTASEITLESKGTQTVTAEGNARLILSNTQTLIANQIIINETGLVKANGGVNVKTENMNCFSDNLVIKPNATKSPQTAIFTGHPHIIQGANTIYADTITYDFATKRAQIIGNVHSE
jgi:LPS export ABC transporter protein LptC